MIHFISDAFAAQRVNDVVRNDLALFEGLTKIEEVQKVSSGQVSIEFLENSKNDLFLLSSISSLNRECVEYFYKNLKQKYIIIDSNSDYVLLNNPARFKNFSIPETHLTNVDLYQNAKKVLVFSTTQEEVVKKNLLIENTLNLSGYCWTEQELHALKDNLNGLKNNSVGILISGDNKFEVAYCEKNNVEYKVVNDEKYQSYVKALAGIEKLLMLPRQFKPVSRAFVEAKILGCKITTNPLTLISSEKVYKQDATEIFKYVQKNNDTIIDTVSKEFKNNEGLLNEENQLPKITLGLTVYKGGKFILNYMEDLVKQTIFPEIEVLIIDANSPDNEDQIIKSYLDANDNIRYVKLDYRASIAEAFNEVLKLATGEFIFFHDVDNFLNPQTLEVLRKNLFYNKDVDLVYSDSIVVREYGKNFNDMKDCYTELLENSKKEFSVNNMIKSLPGPFCMWRRKIYEKVGPFREDYKYAMDWEMWLRMVKHGSKFKKVNNFISGVYYYNSEGGMSTAQKYEKERKKEEAEIFFDYYHIFKEEGEKYIDYFWSFIA